MKNNLVDIFTGSDIEANYIGTLLDKNGILCHIQNTLEESISAGWASGSPNNSTIIRIEIDNYEDAIRIINEYISSLKK